MDLVKQGQTTDIQFGLRMITGNGLIYGAKLIKLTNCTVIISDRFENVTWYYNNSVSQDSHYLSLPFANIFQSFTDPENPTPEEFIMFKIQYGVDWIVEPKDWSL